jgi:inner membrane protein
MDTITHIALGACMGEVLLGKQLGKKAMLIGAFANTWPDIDFLAAFWLDADDNLLTHRGITHSILFMLLSAWLLSLLFKRLYRSYAGTPLRWFLFFLLTISVHLFIDAFNAYGTGLFEPFSHYRVSFNTIFVADPFFSVWLGIAVLLLLVLKQNHRGRRLLGQLGLLLSSIYLLYCIFNKVKVDTTAKAFLKKQDIHYTSYFTTPTPFNDWLWYVVAGNDSGFYTGYYSVFDKQQQLDLHFFSRRDTLLRTLRNEPEVHNLLRFSQGFYTIEQWGDTLVFNDLRFGQMVGWQQPDAKFVFHYFLQHPLDNALVLQRGRFANWDSEATRRLIERIKGK